MNTSMLKTLNLKSGAFIYLSAGYWKAFNEAGVYRGKYETLVDAIRRIS